MRSSSQASLTSLALAQARFGGLFAFWGAKVVAHEALLELRTQRVIEYEREQNRIKDAQARRMASHSSATEDAMKITQANNPPDGQKGRS